MVHFGVETDCTNQAISYKRNGYLTTIVVVLQFGNMGWSTTRVSVQLVATFEPLCMRKLQICTLKC